MADAVVRGAVLWVTVVMVGAGFPVGVEVPNNRVVEVPNTRVVKGTVVRTAMIAVIVVMMANRSVKVAIGLVFKPMILGIMGGMLI